MIQRFMLGAYWKMRQENLEVCTEKAHRFFMGLAKIDPLLAEWYERGRSRKDALKKRRDVTDPAIVRELLLKGRSRRDIGREVMEDLGFHINLWNGAADDEAGASVGIGCGRYTEWVGNNILIYLPQQTEPPGWADHAASLLALVAEVWHPDWAGIMSDRARRERKYDANKPFVDWLVYVPRPVDAVPAPGQVEVLPGLGSIVTVQPDPPTGNDPEELSRIRNVEAVVVA